MEVIPMSYQPTKWNNDAEPSLDAEHLNKLENGLSEAAANADTAKRVGTENTEAINNLEDAIGRVGNYVYQLENELAEETSNREEAVAALDEKLDKFAETNEKFYIPTNGAMDLRDSDSAKIRWLVVYGRSEKSKNQLDLSRVSDGLALGINGGTYADASRFTSAFMPISSGGVFSTTKVSWGNYYDASKTFISQFSNGEGIKAPANCAYIRITALLTDKNEVQVEFGSKRTEYEAYFDGIRSVENARIIMCAENQWDEEWEQGNIGLNGVPVASTACIRSKNYINVESLTKYYISESSRICYYDAALNFISYKDWVKEFTTPEGTKFIKFRVLDAYGNSYKNNIILSLMPTDYAPYIETAADLPFVRDQAQGRPFVVGKGWNGFAYEDRGYVEIRADVTKTYIAKNVRNCRMYVFYMKESGTFSVGDVIEIIDKAIVPPREGTAFYRVQYNTMTGYAMTQELMESCKLEFKEAVELRGIGDARDTIERRTFHNMKQIDLGPLNWSYLEASKQFYCDIPDCKKAANSETANLVCDLYEAMPIDWLNDDAMDLTGIGTRGSATTKLGIVIRDPSKTAADLVGGVATWLIGKKLWYEATTGGQDYSADVLERHAKECKLKDFTWIGTSPNRFRTEEKIPIKKVSSTDIIPNMMASKFGVGCIDSSKSDYYGNHNDTIGMGTVNANMYIRCDSCTTVNELVTYLGEAEAVYELAAPTIQEVHIDDTLLTFYPATHTRVESETGVLPDVEFEYVQATASPEGIILTSPDGHKWLLTASDDGLPRLTRL
jgi:hypothetical protein